MNPYSKVKIKNQNVLIIAKRLEFKLCILWFCKFSLHFVENKYEHDMVEIEAIIWVVAIFTRPVADILPWIPPCEMGFPVTHPGADIFPWPKDKA